MKQNAHLLVKRGSRGSRGQALVEFTLILPLLLFITLGIIDYGRILLVYASVSSSIRDAARNATLFTDDSSGTARYASCDTIEDQARNVILSGTGFVDIQAVNIMYFDTKRQPEITDTTILAAMAQDIEDATTDPNVADFDCSSAYTPPMVTEDSVATGDLMVVTMEVEIDFITPLLANMFPSLELTFRAERTVVTNLDLVPTDADRDNDGLADEWEFNNFGCLLDGYDEEPQTSADFDIVAIRTNGYLILAEAGFPIAKTWVWNTASPLRPSQSSSNNTADWETASFTSDCATEDLNFNADWLRDDPSTWPDFCADATIDDNGTPSDNSDDYMSGCYVPNTYEFNATDDPDTDGCNNGCEEANGTPPLQGLAGAPSNDVDEDGLIDGEEANGSFAFNCIVNGVAYTSPTVPFVTNPLEYDTDGDGLGDGDEVNVYCTDPTVADTDGDGLNDGEEIVLYVTNPAERDTDGDTIEDRTELVGYNVTYTVEGITRTITVLTNPASNDSDGDGLFDNNERDGTAGKVTRPDVADTDNDGLNDGPEYTNNADPTIMDTDGDRLKDGPEVNLYHSLANNTNSDGDSCTGVDNLSHSLSDYREIKGTDAVGHEDANGNGIYNSMELNSDQDSLPDCEEVYYYSTNPYNRDTDGDLMDDDDELDIYCRNPNDPNDDIYPTAASCPADGTLDTDLDGLPDAWEEQYYTPVGSEGPLTDNDNDHCNNACEYDRRTSPNDPDTDDDGLLDGDEVSTRAYDDDTDGDGLKDGSLGGVRGEENGYDGTVGYGTDPTLPDTDGDGLSDYDEVMGTYVYITNPLLPDTDGDGLEDGYEISAKNLTIMVDGAAKTLMNIQTNPTSADSDNDGLTDYNETYVYLTDPSSNDTDGDTLRDGATAGQPGERNNDANPVGLPGIGSSPILTDSDGDGLSDKIEYEGIDNYVITVDGVAQAPINLGGAGDGVTPSFSLTNPDTDGDGLNDGEEVNVFHTNPLLKDTDGDNIWDGLDADPLVKDAAADSDDDGLTDDEEETPPAGMDVTDPLDFDSDNDGMGDGDEFITFSSSATGYNLSTNSSYAITYSETFQLRTTHQNTDGDTLADGYDSDGDGLSDTFELYWWQSASTIRATHPQFRTGGSGTFTGSMEACGYSLGTLNKPLHPDDADTDDDGLTDGDECNVYNTNPFDATSEGQIFDKVTNSSFLNSVVYPSLEGELSLAAASARALGYTLASDGLITVKIVRATSNPSGTQRYLLGTLITGSCGPSAYTNASGTTTTFANVCGVFSGGSEPSKTNNDVSSPVVVRIPLSQFFTILKDSRVVSMTPG